MGSRCTITLYAQAESQAAVAAGDAFKEIAQIERALTDYDPSSEAMRVTQAPLGDWIRVSEILWDVLDRSEQFHALSSGAFDPTVGAYTHLWRSSRNEDRIPTSTELEQASQSVGFGNLDIDRHQNRLRVRVEGMILDFGGIGKGYAADKALGILVDRGYPSAMVNLGGDLAVGDPPPNENRGWVVEIQSGIQRHRQVRLANCGIATSGDLERFFVHQDIRYSHILDPRTGIGLTEQRAVSVIAEDATAADALASIVSVMGKSGADEMKRLFPTVEIELVIGESQSTE